MSAFPPREGLFTSITQVKTWVRCPRQFRLKYVDGLAPAFTPLPLAFGAAIHHGLAQHYGHVKMFGKAPELDEVVQAFRDEWERFATGPIPIRTGGEDGDDADLAVHVDKGAQMLAVFHSHAAEQGLPDVHAVEMPFTIDLHAPDTGEVFEEKLTGFIDLVLTEDGRKVIVEHKSSARKYAADQLRFDPQLTAYQLAAREVGLGEAGLRFQVITKTKVPAVQVEDVRRDEQDEDDFMWLVKGVLAAINAGISWPTRSWACASCPFQYACRSSARRS